MPEPLHSIITKDACPFKIVKELDLAKRRSEAIDKEVSLVLLISEKSIIYQQQIAIYKRHTSVKTSEGP